MKTKLHRLITARVATFIAALGLQLALAQTPDPAAFVATDQPGYQPGGIVMITGGGFQAGETVSLQVLRTDGTNCPSPQHESWTVVADETGAIQADWFLCPEDPPSTTLQLSATGQTSARAAAAAFVNSAAIAAYVNTDQVDYAPGSTVYITGGGFNAGENVPCKSSMRMARGPMIPSTNPGPWWRMPTARSRPLGMWATTTLALPSRSSPSAAPQTQLPIRRSPTATAMLVHCSSARSFTPRVLGPWRWVISTATARPTWPWETTVGNNVSVLLGNGNGTSRRPSTTLRGSNPLSVAVGDFNGDGKPDLAVANTGQQRDRCCSATATARSRQRQLRRGDRPYVRCGG